MKPTSRGGTGELKILANHFKKMICVVHAGNGWGIDKYGKPNQYDESIYLFFNGYWYGLGLQILS